MKNLTTIAKFCNCKFIDDMPNIRKHIDMGLVIEALDRFYKRYGDDVVLFGGQAATPWFYGFTRLRYHTTDIDFVVKESRIEQVVRDYELMYHPRYNVFVTYVNSIMCVFSSGIVHNWEIPDDFFATSSAVHFGSYRTQVCSPEYLIAQKFRRGYFSDEKLFGKDALDILNILIAPYIRDDLDMINIRRTAELSVQLTGNRLPENIEALQKLIQHLPPKHKPLAEEKVNSLKEAIEEVLK